MPATSRPGLAQTVKHTMFALIATAVVATNGVTGCALAEPGVAPAAYGVEATIDDVPWSQVGPGWTLAMWSPVSGLQPGEQAPENEPTRESAPTTLYLVDPAGGRYAITTFPPPGDGPAPELADWSGDGSRALFYTRQHDGSTTVIEVDLHSGTQRTFTVDRSDVLPQFTRPEGEAILLSTTESGSASLERVDLAGRHQLSYPVGQDFNGYVYTLDGTQLVVGTASGLALMGNDGTPGRELPVAEQTDCTPTRWWDADSTVVVARCQDSSTSQLWLVPVDGSAPTALTAPNDGHSVPDLGDLNAWQLPAGTYLQAMGACGVIFLAKLNADGTTSPVSVPDVEGESIAVVGANGGSLYLQAKAECGGGQSLLEYDPATGTTTVLLGPPVNGGGVIEALPYPGTE